MKFTTYIYKCKVYGHEYIFKGIILFFFLTCFFIYGAVGRGKEGETCVLRGGPGGGGGDRCGRSPAH